MSDGVQADLEKKGRGSPVSNSKWPKRIEEVEFLIIKLTAVFLLLAAVIKVVRAEFGI